MKKFDWKCFTQRPPCMYDHISQFHCAEAKTHFTVSNPKRGFKQCEIEVQIQLMISLELGHYLTWVWLWVNHHWKSKKSPQSANRARWKFQVQLPITSHLKSCLRFRSHWALMAYSHCWIQTQIPTQIPTQTRIPVLCRNFILVQNQTLILLLKCM